jgi:hypothetical protein
MSIPFSPCSGETCSSDFPRARMDIFNAAMAQGLLLYYATQQEMLDYFAIPLGNLVISPDPGPEPAVNPIPPHAAWVENRKVFLDILTTFSKNHLFKVKILWR